MKKVLVMGSHDRLEEFKKLELKNAKVSYSENFVLDPMIQMFSDDEGFGEGEAFSVDLTPFDIIFDLNLDDNIDNLEYFQSFEDKIIIGCAVKNSLAMMMHDFMEEPEFRLYGMNALPSFINRPVLEMSVYDDGDEEELAALMAELGLEFQLVEDRVGMVTPRIICMIINEATFVLQEGTATVPDVDRAMKLGTNYPMGPFEWADKMNVQNVFEVLESLRRDTGEEKYKIAPLLKRKYLKGESFLN